VGVASLLAKTARPAITLLVAPGAKVLGLVTFAPLLLSALIFKELLLPSVRYLLAKLPQIVVPAPQRLSELLEIVFGARVTLVVPVSRLRMIAMLVIRLTIALSRTLALAATAIRVLLLSTAITLNFAITVVEALSPRASSTMVLFVIEVPLLYQTLLSAQFALFTQIVIPAPPTLPTTAIGVKAWVPLPA